jgi:hypothetical protein
VIFRRILAGLQAQNITLLTRDFELQNGDQRRWVEINDDTLDSLRELLDYRSKLMHFSLDLDHAFCCVNNTFIQSIS